MAVKQDTQSRAAVARLVVDNTAAFAREARSSGQAPARTKFQVIQCNRALPRKVLALGPNRRTKRIAISEQRIPTALINNLSMKLCRIGFIGETIGGSLTISYGGRRRTIFGKFAPLEKGVDLILPTGTL